MIRRLLSATLAFVFSIMPFGMFASHQEDAYMLVFEQSINEDRKFKNIAVDLTKVKLKNTSKLVERLQAYCDERGATLLLDDYQGLKEKGYIKIKYFKLGDGMLEPYPHFEDGIFIRFNDIELTKNSLVTTVDFFTTGWWYEVKRIRGEWQIVETSRAWIS